MLLNSAFLSPNRPDYFSVIGRVQTQRTQSNLVNVLVRIQHEYIVKQPVKCAPVQSPIPSPIASPIISPTVGYHYFAVQTLGSHASPSHTSRYQISSLRQGGRAKATRRCRILVAAFWHSFLSGVYHACGGPVHHHSFWASHARLDIHVPI